MIWLSPDPGSGLYHCPVGHTFSMEALHEEHRLVVEQALWAGARSLHEQAAIAGHLASRAEESGSETLARQYRERQRRALQNSRTLEGILAQPAEPLPAAELAAQPEVSAG